MSTPPQLSQLKLQLDVFEGPLELLLSLIEQRHLPITQVSLAQVADQYLAHIHAREELDRDLLADFLAIAARLLLLKSRALLLTDEPDPVAEEVASDLAERLATYRVFRAAAEALRDLEQRAQRTYASGREPLASARPAVLAPISLDSLLAAWRRLASSAPGEAQVELPGVTRASVEERRAIVLEVLRTQARVSFRQVAGQTVDEVVATFLALLELVRRGTIALDQPAPFGDLSIARI